MNADPAVIGGLAGTVLAILAVVVVLVVGSIVAGFAFDARIDAKLKAHEDRENKLNTDRHAELTGLIRELRERIDNLYERQAGG